MGKGQMLTALWELFGIFDVISGGFPWPLLLPLIPIFGAILFQLWFRKRFGSWYQPRRHG
jgi:hypothetical protein